MNSSGLVRWLSASTTGHVSDGHVEAGCGAGESQAVTRDPRARARPARLAHRQVRPGDHVCPGPGVRAQPRRTVAFSAAARRSSTAGSALRHCTSDAPAASTDSRPSVTPSRWSTRSWRARGHRRRCPARRPAAGVGEHLGHRRARQRGRVAGHRVPRHELVAVQPDLGGEVDRRPQAAPAGPCRTRPATAPRPRPPARRPARGRGGRRRRAPTRRQAGRRRPRPRTTTPPAGPPPSASARAAARATGVPGSTSHSSRSRLAAFAAQFAVVIAGQLDALAGGVVVEGDQRAGGGGLRQARVQQGGGERHRWVLPRVTAADRSNGPLVGTCPPPAGRSVPPSVDAGHARRGDRVPGRARRPRRRRRRQLRGSKSAPSTHLQVPRGHLSSLLHLDPAQLSATASAGVAVGAGVADDRSSIRLGVVHGAADEAESAQAARAPGRRARPRPSRCARRPRSGAAIAAVGGGRGRLGGGLLRGLGGGLLLGDALVDEVLHLRRVDQHDVAAVVGLACRRSGWSGTRGCPPRCRRPAGRTRAGPSRRR